MISFRAGERHGGVPAEKADAALRVVRAITRFAATGAGNVQGLHGVHPPEFRLRVGDWRVRFHDHGDWIDVLRVRSRKDAYR